MSHWAAEYDKEIFRVTYPLIRATCPQERSQRPLKRAKGPQKPFARVQIMVLKGPCILVKKNKDTFFNPTLKQKKLWNFLILHLKAKHKAYSYFVIWTIQNDFKFTSGKIKRVQSRADNYNAYHKLAVAVAEVKGSSIAITLVLLQQQHIAI